MEHWLYDNLRKGAFKTDFTVIIPSQPDWNTRYEPCGPHQKLHCLLVEQTVSFSPLRKQAYIENFTKKNETFQIKILISFIFLLKT